MNSFLSYLYLVTLESSKLKRVIRRYEIGTSIRRSTVYGVLILTLLDQLANNYLLSN